MRIALSSIALALGTTLLCVDAVPAHQQHQKTHAKRSGSSWPSKIFAPYVDTMLWPTFDVNTVNTAVGTKYFTLAFFVSGYTGNRDPAWGGITAYSDGFYLDQINTLRAAGGDVIVSFGGASGIEPAGIAVDAEHVAAQYQAVIDTYSLTYIDFDIEGGAVTNKTAIDIRNQAIALLQKKNPDLLVSYTLPILPTGLTNDGVYLIESAAKYGADIRVVNGMAMDYGEVVAPNGDTKMGDYAIQAGEAIYSQIQAAGLSAGVGITPMIGQNDVQDEIFTFDNAVQVVEWAEKNDYVQLLSYWSANRDVNNPSAPLYASTQIEQEDYDFGKIFVNFGTGSTPSLPDDSTALVTGASSSTSTSSSTKKTTATTSASASASASCAAQSTEIKYITRTTTAVSTKFATSTVTKTESAAATTVTALIPVSELSKISQRDDIAEILNPEDWDFSAMQERDSNIIPLNANQIQSLKYIGSIAPATTYCVTTITSSPSATSATSLATTTAQAGKLGSSSVWNDTTVAPYVDVTDWPTFSISTAAKSSGGLHYTLGFIVSDDNGSPSWGGYYDAINDDFYEDIISSLRKQGGDVIVSFGGAAGTELGVKITDVTKLYKAYKSVISKFNFTWADFDIEGSALGKTTSVQTRNNALLKLKKDYPELVISFTLPVEINGLTDSALTLLSHAKSIGLQVDVVNIMTMDYGDYYFGKYTGCKDPSTDMGACSIISAQNTRQQLIDLGLSSTKIGVTPMIGVNDVTNQIFRVADAKELLEFAQKTSYIAEIAYWSINRDNSDGAGITVNTYDYINTFKSYDLSSK